MKIKVLGNSCTWFMRPNTNFLVDEVMLIDTPQSFTKFFHIDYEKLKYILITHFHSDHFTDLHIICDYLFKRKNKEKVKLIAQKRHSIGYINLANFWN